MSLKIGIVVGEVSGDMLGAELIAELKKYVPNLESEGVIGPNLLGQGTKQLASMERLTVMGFVEPLKRLPELYRLRKWLEKYFISDPPDLFIGIDAPEFNLGLEKKLKAAAIPVVHYVSPSVWAWRESRLKLIRQAVDLILTLFPFEEKYYQDKHIPAKFVGHPAANKIPLQPDIYAARRTLGYKKDDKIIALLPGSRNAELKYLAKIYLQVAQLCAEYDPSIKFILPLVNQEQQKYINKLYLDLNTNLNNMPLVYSLVGKTYTAITASDLVLVTSGTATLEVMLHKKPMVIAYKTNWLTYWLVKMLIKVPYIGLPNLLADKLIVKELIQTKANAKNLFQAIKNLLTQPGLQQQQIAKFIELHKSLRKLAGVTAASEIMQMLDMDVD